MSGILIGVAAVIILISAGTGANRSITDQITALGANTLTITPNSTLAGGRNNQSRNGGAAATAVNSGTETRTSQLTIEDAEALVDPVLAPDVGLVAPVVSPQSITATTNGATHTVTTFTGTSPSYLTINSNTVQAGVPFTDSDYLGRRRAALLGPTVAKELVGGDGLVDRGADRAVQRRGVRGDRRPRGQGEPGPPGPRRRRDRPVDGRAGHARELRQPVVSIAAQATASDRVNTAQDQISAILVARHHVTPADADFTIFNPSSILETVNTVTGTFTLLLGAVAGISLFVGGIGVMNIMLVTVTERTREIGIRKAIGAQRTDIVGQFLLEAVLLSVIGGSIGVVIGVLVGSAKIGTFQLVVAPYSIVLAFVVSVAIGLFFGWYPANRAASLRPIDALRYE